MLDQLTTLFKYNNEEQIFRNFLVFDADISGGGNWNPEILKTIKSRPRLLKILCTEISANPKIPWQLSHPYFVGYIMEDMNQSPIPLGR